MLSQHIAGNVLENVTIYKLFYLIIFYFIFILFYFITITDVIVILERLYWFFDGNKPIAFYFWLVKYA